MTCLKKEILLQLHGASAVSILRNSSVSLLFPLILSFLFLLFLPFLLPIANSLGVAFKNKMLLSQGSCIYLLGFIANALFRLLLLAGRLRHGFHTLFGELQVHFFFAASYTYLVGSLSNSSCLQLQLKNTVLHLTFSKNTIW